MMDNTVDASRFPLPQQKEEAQAKRRIGLGVTGLADALLMVGSAVWVGGGHAALTACWLRRIARAAYLTSAQLASRERAVSAF